MTTISQLEAHGIPVTATGTGPLETTAVVDNVDQLHSLLDLGLDEQGRQAHYQALFSGIQPADPGSGPAAAADDGGASLADRITAHVIGNRELSADDRAEIAPVFPLTVQVAAAAGPLTVSSMYDLSTPDGSPRIASFTDVTLLQGGYFVCAGTPLIFTCDTLTRTGNSGGPAADFNITGKMGATPPTPPVPGSASQAAAGALGECSNPGVAGPGGQPGSPGAAGTPGTAGAPGNPGTPSMQATITIRQTLTITPHSATALTIHSVSGLGGPGGNGGPGGEGQQGGDGGNGVSCDCTGNSGGQAGNGGPGGTGGAAGNGGNGANAAGNVVIRVPSRADIAKVSFATTPASPGAPGEPGPGGPGAAPGTPGSGGKNMSGGFEGETGSPGAAGAQGQPGTATGKPAEITVTRPLSS